MNVAGIIAEYNPFHRGHAWHIARTRRTLGADTAVVCVMSGHWVQRGECALTDKWSRAALALSGGADLVLELPTPWAMASAESFARGAVGLLAATGVVDVLSFGSETGELAPLRAAAAALDGPDYPERLRAGLARGLSFPAARQAAVGAYCLASPNDNLGVEYLRALPPGMEALTIPRRGAAHDGPAAGGFASASELRALLRAGRAAEADPYLTAPWSGAAASMAHIDRAVLARLRMMDEADWAALPDGGVAEGLPARLARSARTADSLQRENERLRELAELKKEKEDYQLASAYIITWDSNDWTSSFTINKGSGSGIAEDMVAITAQGDVVGLVTAVGSNWATVTTVLDSALEVSANIASSGYAGMVQGAYTTGAEGMLRMDYLPTDAVIRNNEPVVTAGSTLYPRDLILGYVADAGFDETGVAKYALLTPAADFENMEQVFILTSYQNE